MRIPLRIRLHRGATRTWLGGALIALGATLNVMAIVLAGATSGDPAGFAPSEVLPVDSFQPASSASPSPTGRPPTTPGSQHHAPAPTAAPPPSSALEHSMGGLTAGHRAGGTNDDSWAAEALERAVIEGLVPAGRVAEPGPAFVTDMPPAVHVTVPAVGIDTNVVEVAPAKSDVDGRAVFTWTVADWAAGHHSTSADPGEGGNIVLSGHDDVRGEVFRGLHDIHLGDQVTLISPAGAFNYTVTEIHVREYRKASPEERIAAGGFLAPMPEERVTLVTCWPYGIDTHRIIVVAMPIELPNG